MARLPLTLSPLILLLGCDPDCETPARINGEYAVLSTISAVSASTTGTDYPFDAVFFNGWSEWELKYIPSQKGFQIYIDDQPFSASFEQSAENCNNFTMSIEGDYTSSEGNIHSFGWDANLTYFGTHLGGIFTYSDTWSSSDGSATGTLSELQGEYSANLTDGDSG
ncbi:MAG: hypothetical protein QGG40_04845 [Myxococcota bacterium]|nr:hypothetical protein [Myxococcota bacterium]